MDIDSIGQALRLARKQRRLTQAAVSELVGMSRATLSGIENGTVTEIGIRKVMALCSVLGLELTVQVMSPRRSNLQARSLKLGTTSQIGVHNAVCAYLRVGLWAKR